MTHLLQDGVRCGRSCAAIGGDGKAAQRIWPRLLLLAVCGILSPQELKAKGGQMSDTRYEAPSTLSAAVALLAGANGQARVLAGGTDLLIQMRGGRVEPTLVVDIKNIAEMRSIALENGAWRFGAAVTSMELLAHEG